MIWIASEPAHPVIEGESKRVVLRLVPPRAEPEDQPAAADLVDRVRHLGDQRRIAKTGAGHQGSDLDPVSCRRKRRQQRPDIPHPLRSHAGKAKEQMIG
jgi:hypothetical protein